jgi:hypothetical protein
MSKVCICIEYPIKKAPLPVLWTSIGTPLGLSEWFAEGVTIVGDEYTFMWDGYEQTAKLLPSKVNSFIRFQWIEDEGTDAYFEIRIEKQAISGQLSFLITDYVQADEKEEILMLWNKHIETLRRKIGI